ncbi:MAG TPA: 4-alpha-glucanotransferase [Ensifer sp.]|jgi:4-alpha-glucanotransferase|uniref:4-alpha-glucanotransferase n=1 Tax=Ensifer sp. TaxID=1872086 RepID=UPI002E11B38B|nr:4-alpha-glucanotransferase [Ensifer sp.]
MSDETLRQLSTKAGIATHWTDQAGTERAVSPESLRAILAALGWQATSLADMNHSLVLAAGGAMLHGSARFVTARLGELVSLPAQVPAGTPVSIVLEGGGERVVRSLEALDGELVLPAFDIPGYHVARLPDGDFTVAVAPPRCVTFADVAGRSGWGLAAQIYSLRSEGDGGIGNFTGVAALGRAAAAQGADALAISPVHALYGAFPAQFSPYSPSSRLFYNPLHADPSALIPEDLLRALIQNSGVAEEMAALSAQELIDWPVATALKQRLLRGVFDALRATRVHATGEDFERFQRRASPLLRDHAVFEALQAAELNRDPGAGYWRNWPAALRDPRSAEVAAFAQAHAGEVDYHIFLQWLLGRSYAQAQKACSDAGMAVGLIADLAIGMDGAGSHAWSRQDEVLIGLSIGAPPDYYAADGQNWGLTTFSPLGLSASGYAPFIETMRASLRHVGGIRIDHVMGMSRLWLIPEGGSALDGAYVQFPSETLFRLIALESWRHRAIVIGEDLGTLPYGFRDYLREQGVAGLRVLRFERTEHGYVPPQDWDAQAVALTTTHDLVPTAGWWAGADLDPNGEEQQAVRAWDRGLLWGSFRNAGLVQGERPEPADIDAVVDAAVAYVAATPCALKIVPMEDALGISTQPNVPGTTVEKPNWRHRLSGDAASLLDDPTVRRRLAQLERSRRG